MAARSPETLWCWFGGDVRSTEWSAPLLSVLASKALGSLELGQRPHMKAPTLWVSTQPSHSSILLPLKTTKLYSARSVHCQHQARPIVLSRGAAIFST